MDISQAISILRTESDNLGVDISNKMQLQVALDLALQQLKGILAAQLAELETEKTKSTDLQTQLDTAAATITDLVAQLETKLAMPRIDVPIEATSTPSTS